MQVAMERIITEIDEYAGCAVLRGDRTLREHAQRFVEDGVSGVFLLWIWRRVLRGTSMTAKGVVGACHIPAFYTMRTPKPQLPEARAMAV